MSSVSSPLGSSLPASGQALLVLCASVLAWAGGWSLLDRADTSAVAEACVLAAGVLLALGSNTFFLNAGVPVRSDTWPAIEAAVGAASARAAPVCGTARDTVAAYARSAFGLAGLVFVWFGLYSLVKRALDDSNALLSALLLAGGLLLLAASTAKELSPAGLAAALVAAAEDDDGAAAQQQEEEGSSLLGRRQPSASHAESMVVERPGPVWYGRAALVYAGGVAAWVGGENLLEVSAPGRSLLRELLYVAAGLALMLVTRTLVSSVRRDLAAAADDPAFGVPEYSFPSRVARAGVSALGFFLFWVGLETTLVEYLAGASLARDALYLGSGVLVLVATGTFHAQAGALSPLSAVTNLELHQLKRESL